MRRTIPQIEVIMTRLNRHIGLKLGVQVDDTAVIDDEHTVEDGMALAAMFRDISG